MRRVSRDQAGVAVAGCWTTARRESPVPSGLRTHTPGSGTVSSTSPGKTTLASATGRWRPSTVAPAASRAPSGAQEGEKNSPALLDVSCDCAVPSACMVQISDLPLRVLAKARFPPGSETATVVNVVDVAPPTSWTVIATPYVVAAA